MKIHYIKGIARINKEGKESKSPTNSPYLSYREVRPRRLECGVVLLGVEVGVVGGRQRPEQVAGNLEHELRGENRFINHKGVGD